MSQLPKICLLSSAITILGMIPQSWRRYTVPSGITVIQWITDFSQRVKQLQTIVQVTQQGGAKELKVRSAHQISYVFGDF